MKFTPVPFAGAGCSSIFSLFLMMIFLFALFAWQAPLVAQGAVSPGDIVETNINYQPVIGEVLRSYGNLADLNLGQNNVGRYLEVQYMKVVQKAGTGGTSKFNPGDTVQRSNGSIVITGRIMKTNGSYCEIDSSGSGFTGWSKCAELRLVSKAPESYLTSAAAGPTAVLALASGFSQEAGKPNPVGNHGFYLLKDPVDTALTKGGFQPPAGLSPVNGMHLVCTKQTPDCQKAVAAIILNSATAVKSGPEGKAVFPAVLPGVYYVFGMGQHQGKPLLWNVRVQIKAGDNSVTLDDRNASALESPR
jgi:hypothetical protein